MKIDLGKVEELDLEKLKLKKLEELNIKIKYSKRARNSKIASNIIRGITIGLPVAAIGTALGIFFVHEKDIPGIRDYVEKHAYNTLTYSSDTGLLDKDTEYVTSNIEEDDVMVYYGPWVQQNDGSYVSSIKEYTLNDISEEDLEKLINKKDLSFDDFFSLSVKETKEDEFRKYSLTQEEAEKGAHYEIKVYNNDKNDTVIAKETSAENLDDIKGLLLCFFVVAASEGLIYSFAGDKLRFESIKVETERIKEYKKMKKELGE